MQDEESFRVEYLQVQAEQAKMGYAGPAVLMRRKNMP